MVSWLCVVSLSVLKLRGFEIGAINTFETVSTTKIKRLRLKNNVGKLAVIQEVCLRSLLFHDTESASLKCYP